MGPLLATAAEQDSIPAGAICCMLVVFLAILGGWLITGRRKRRSYSDFRRPPHR